MSYEYPQSGLPRAVPNSSMAIVSLVCGILGLTILPFIGSVVALITGYMAKKEIQQSGGALGGDGMVTAGLVMGWIGVALGVIGMCVAGVAIAIPFCVGLGLYNQSTWIIPGLIALI
jgi:hypothetical protein